MASNTTLHYVLLVAALLMWGCGGGGSPTAANQPQPTTDAGDTGTADQDTTPEGGDTDKPDAYCVTSKHMACEPCETEGLKDPCSTLECIDGFWQDPLVNSKPCIDQDAGTEAGEDAEPDSEPDVIVPDGGEEADVLPPAEQCNGIDDDQDGDIDEDFECVFGSGTVACQTACDPSGVMSGTQTCNDDCTLSACTPPQEVCSGADDVIDEDCDGKAGCTDPDCYGESFCAPSEICNNQIDDDGDNQIDCADDDCVGYSACNEVCDGVDNNQNGQIDEDDECALGSDPVACTTTCNSVGQEHCQANCTYGACVPPAEQCNGKDDDCDGNIDNGYECAYGSAPVTCTNACGGPGTRPCNSSCNLGACVPVATETDCDNDIDDNCNGKTDCEELSCTSAPNCQAPQHNFGDCSMPQSPGIGMNCSWTQDTLTAGDWSLILDSCANSLGEHFVAGGTYGEWRIARNTNGTTWNQVNLPIIGSPTMGIPSLTCTGSGVYTVYNAGNNGSGSGGTVALRFNGTGWDQIGASYLASKLSSASWGMGSTLWIAARSAVPDSDTKIYKWNGSTFSEATLPSFAPMQIAVNNMWGSSFTDVYLVGMEYDPTDSGNMSKQRGVILHWDGNTWAEVQTAQQWNGSSWVAVQISSVVRQFSRIDGSSGCDVAITGDDGAHGVTLERVGNTWELNVYTQYVGMGGVAKKSATEYVVQAKEKIGAIGKVWMGEVKSDGLLDWVAPDDQLYSAGSVMHVPESNLFIMGGTGEYGAAIYRSTCN